MKTLIFKIQGNKYVNHSFFRPYLYIYDNCVIYKKRRKMFFVDEITMPYEHISRVNLHKGILFSKIEMVLSGGAEMVHIKGVLNWNARKAKNLLDKKIQLAHNKNKVDHTKVGDSVESALSNFEMSIKRLEELLQRKRISQRDFNKRKKELLKLIE